MSTAISRVREAKERALALGLASRTSLAFGLVLAMGADFLLLKSGFWQPWITSLQSVLLLGALFTALRSDHTEKLTRAQRRTARVIAYFAGSAAIAAIALIQKWWILLEADVASRPAYAGTYRVMGATATLVGVALVLGRSRRLARFFVAFAEQPARQTAFSFVALTMFGAFLLTLPICVRDPSHVSFVDALFMAASAVCVTGLSLHNLATEYTAWGQGVLLGLVQAGGLGIMVLSASLIVLTGRKLRARSSAVLAEVIDAESVASLRSSILRIVGFTLAIEALGAVVLYQLFSSHPEIALGHSSAHPKAGPGSLLWAAIFHAISAFCNAGFTLTHGGLEPFASSYGVCSTLMVLIVLGGLGFPVLSELSSWLVQRARRQRPRRLSLHTRTVLLMSLVLIGAVALMLAAVEWNAAFAGKTWYERAFAALFQSVTLRTAGFSTVELGAFTDAGLMIGMMFMFVGAAPGGTGGGLKVTTLAVLFATMRAELRNAKEPYLLDRRLPPSTVRRAISLAFVAAVVLTCSVLSLLLSEHADAIDLAFEAVSAFGTVGLSTGITASLTASGKLTIILTMLIGRIGPLTIALASAERSERAHHLRAHERVLIG